MTYEVKSRLLTAKEAALYLRVHLATIYDWVAKGMIPSVKLGRKRMFDRIALDRWIDSQAELGHDQGRSIYKKPGKWHLRK